MTEIYENSYNAALMGGTPYYDDFDPDKKFLKVLFKPGLPLQAREVSQIQTLLQNQIERFGNHTFKNGSVVLGGAVTASTGFFVRLNEVLPTATLNNLVGQKIRHTDDNNLNTDGVVVGVTIDQVLGPELDLFSGDMLYIEGLTQEISRFFEQTDIFRFTFEF